VIGLIASILGIIGILPLIGSLVGVIAGNSAKGDIRNRPGQVTGEGLASAAVVIGWIGLALWGLGCCVTALLLGLGVVAVPSAGACAELSGEFSRLPILPVAGMIISSICYLKFK
jgi:hypothetical protein